MDIPFHPMMVHFPIALSFILPFLIIVFAFMLKSNKMNHNAWLIIIGLQLVTTASGYLALETGEDEEHLVEKVLDKKLIHEHEEKAEIFVGSTVIALVISIAAFFIKKEFQFPLHLLIALVSFVSCYLAFAAGESGGELVYRHGAAAAYTQSPKGSETPSGLLPTPGMNTSESPMPLEENDSLKRDENDYGESDENVEVEDDYIKQED